MNIPDRKRRIWAFSGHVFGAGKVDVRALMLTVGHQGTGWDGCGFSRRIGDTSGAIDHGSNEAILGDIRVVRRTGSRTGSVHIHQGKGALVGTVAVRGCHRIRVITVAVSVTTSVTISGAIRGQTDSTGRQTSGLCGTIIVDVETVRREE